MTNGKMRILFNLAGDRNKASSRVRGYWIGEALEELGHTVSYAHVNSKADYLRLTARIARHDVVIFQKSYSRYHPAILRLARAAGKRVFFDIDDAPSRVGNPRVERTARWMMRNCHGVLAGSSALVRVAREEQDRVHFVPSGIRLENYVVQPVDTHDPARVCLGWIGNGAHYADDILGILTEPLRKVAADRPVTLRIVGANGEQRLHTAFDGIPGLTAEVIDGVDWSSPAAISDAVAPFDIGLYPLFAGPFNDYKCGFKALEYMATGIPVLASDAANHAEIVEEGVSGHLLRSPDDWVRALSDLAGNTAKRRAMGAAGRKIVEDRFDTRRIAADLEGILSDGR